MHDGIIIASQYLCDTMRIPLPRFRAEPDKGQKDMCRYDIDACEIVVAERDDVSGSLFSLVYSLRMYYLHLKGKLFSSDSFTADGLNIYSDLHRVNPDAYEYAQSIVRLSDEPSPPLLIIDNKGRAHVNPDFEYNPFKKSPSLPNLEAFLNLRREYSKTHRRRHRVEFYSGAKIFWYDPISFSEILAKCDDGDYCVREQLSILNDFYNELGIRSIDDDSSRE